MPTAKLTDSQCRAAKPRAKAYKLFDGAGLALVVLPSGVKSWRLFYRVGGRQQTLALGLYPETGAAEARRKAADARAAVGAGAAPPRRLGAAPAPILTLEQACRDYWKGRQDVTTGYRENALRGLELHIWPTLGAIDVAALTRQQVLAALTTLDAKGRHVYVRKVRVWLSLALDRCVELELAPANVARSINPERAFGRRAVVHHAAVGLDEVPALMRRMALEGELQSAMALKLLALTWVRTGELRMMRWDEIDGDLWRIPAGKMKRRRDHMVPLSKQAVDMLARLKPRAGRSPYVLPAEHREDRPISENTVLALLDRMGYGGRMTGHGFRTVASTWAHEAGYAPDPIERQLAHAPDDKVRAAYNRAEYIDIRRSMLQAWANWLLPPPDAAGS